MKIEGTTRVGAEKTAVWGVLTDPERLTALLPAGEVVARDDEVWQARLSSPTALGSSPFDFVFKLLEKRPEEYVRVFGHGYGSQNIVDLTAEILLSEVEGGTEVRWSSDVRLGGVLASLGQRSVPYVVRRQIEDVLEKVGERRAEVRA